MAVEPIVYVVDDDQESRLSVSALVRSMGLRAESFSSAEEFLGSYHKDQPGCLVTDVLMPGMNGLELQERLQQRNILLPVILVTAYAQIPMAVRAMKHGAVTFLEKPCRENQLCQAVRDALARDAEIQEDRVTREEYRRRLDSLTSAEREVLALVIGGVPNREIAQRLGKSLRTVEARRGEIYRKTQTESVAQVVKLVMIAKDGE